MNRSIFAVAALFASAIAHGQILVYVDGAQVMFPGQGPTKEATRIYVPLRGVLEQMGAKVGWDPAARRIEAERGSTKIEMRVGDFTALVNGMEQRLDAPAMIKGGSTLVPLRFVATALGAEVKWLADQQTVQILTTPGSPTTKPAPAADGITGFKASPTGWVGPGGTLTFEVTGAPGAKVTVKAGVLTPQPLVLRETSPGVYSALWRPGATVYSARQRATASMQVGNVIKERDLPGVVQVDTRAPIIKNWTPTTPSTETNRPELTAVFDDAGGSQVDPAKVKVFWDGEDVTKSAKITANFFTFRSEKGKANGEYIAKVVVEDRAGNRSEKEWKVVIRR